MYRLLIGFDAATPADQAITEAISEWLEACQRDGYKPAEEPTAQIVPDPEHEAMGEILVQVTGRRKRGDQ